MAKQPTWAREAHSGLGLDTRTRFRLTSLDALRAAMLARGFTSGNQLAVASGVKVGTINHLVHGRRDTASPATVRAIREALGRDAKDLFVLEKSTIHVDGAQVGAA